MKIESIYSWRDIVNMTALGIAYLLTAHIVMSGFRSNELVAPIWPPAGLALASLLIGGMRLWPGITAGAFLSNYLIGKPFWATISFVFGDTLEPLIAIYLLNRQCKDCSVDQIANMCRPGDYRRIGAAAVIAVIISGLVISMGLFFSGELKPNTLLVNMLRIWITNLTGIVCLSPFMLIWRMLPKGWFDRGRAIETILFMGLAVLFGQIIFLGWLHQWVGHIARGYWVLIFIFWGAVRFGVHGMVLYLLLTAVQAMVGAALEVGFFGNDIRESGLINLQFALMLISIVGLLLALVINELRQSQADMKLSSLVYQNSGEAMMVTDDLNRIISVNPAFTEITGYRPEDVVGKNPKILASNTHGKAFFQTMWESVNKTGCWRGEIRNRRKNGEAYTELLNINSVYNSDGTLKYRVGLFSDISERKKNEELIWKQANFDALTELPNRWRITGELDIALKRCEIQGGKLAIILIDLDDFKAINETHNHAFGDQLLREIAMRICQCVPESYKVGRLGGDEFVVVSDMMADMGDIETVANRILGKLERLYQIDDEIVYASASIGITEYPKDATDVDTMLKRADQAMYAAKRQGRNRMSYYSPVMQKAVDDRMRLAIDLRSALPAQQLSVYYQPIVHLASGNISKAEALLRWQHPTLGMVSPAAFIPVAEETGLISEIGDWVFRQAAAQTAMLQTGFDPEFQISVNKSPIQFKSNPNGCAQWVEYLHKQGLSGHSIVVEITEGLLMEAKEDTSLLLFMLRDHGMQVALDDFGTGYSSLAYLKKFDIDYIKIDQSFVRNLSKDSNDFVLCEAMIVMAHKLGLSVIAEGVETEGQRNLLHEIGCDYGQGYFFSRPVPAEDFIELIAKKRASKNQAFG
ncbi:bifunctional diguanylate cyclase/phosphodiesterase [Methylomonas sp. MgM2]